MPRKTRWFLVSPHYHNVAGKGFSLVLLITCPGRMAAPADQAGRARLNPSVRMRGQQTGTGQARYAKTAINSRVTKTRGGKQSVNPTWEVATMAESMKMCGLRSTRPGFSITRQPVTNEFAYFAVPDGRRCH